MKNLAEIKLIIFDLDRTIFDWDYVQKVAFEQINTLLPPINTDDFWAFYLNNQELLFKKYVEKTITIEQFRFLRFSQSLEHFSVFDHQLAQNLSETFLRITHNTQAFCLGAEQILDYVKALELTIVLLTNGPSIGQRKKIKNLDLEKYFHKIYISEETGHPKPKPDAFLQILNYLNVQPQHCLMIGDDWEVDLVQAKKLGMQTFWVQQANSELDETQGSLLDLEKQLRKQIKNPF